MRKELIKNWYKEPPKWKGSWYCEFLTTEWKCSVYNQRPIICRSFSDTRLIMKRWDRQVKTQSCTYSKPKELTASTEFIRYWKDLYSKWIVIWSKDILNEFDIKIKSMNKINLEWAKKYIESLWYEVCYIWIYGSQNYWLDLYTSEYQSDIDYKAILVPSLRQLVNNSQPVSTTLEFEGWQIDLKDIRVFMDTLVKCNPAYIEILYTDFCIYDKELFWPIISLKDDLINEMWIFLLKACYWMTLEKQKALCHPYPTIKDKIDKFWYDPKQLHHIYRLRLFMISFLQWKLEWKPKDSTEIEFLLDLKKWKFGLETAKEMADEYVLKCKLIVDSYNIQPIFHTKNKIIELSRELIYNRIIEWIKKESGL